ncbi:MAG: bifunctional riboflavin kinase/FAD synthetase [Kangiellaceae bacterium]|jgi:riboflavin kinase/FMN adenylyltransferase|nr:bifunctional riboflavin kinase/FAD synthetase [Kangiellaceae bacterium]
MRLIRGLTNLTHLPSGCVATIGKFDGVHCGHQQIIAAVKQKALALAIPSVVIVFEPDPQEFFAGNNAPARLTRFREKWQQLAQLDVDIVLCLKFNQAFAQLSAEYFIKQVLIAQLNTKHLIVGDDFRFGADRKGSYQMLQELGGEHFTVQATASIKQGSMRVSSSLVRQVLAEDNFAEASKLLGREYRMLGRVNHGEKVGRTIGFPTMNIPVQRKVMPINGVFLVRVHGLSEEPLWAIANIGQRPTVNKVKKRLEVFVFDFNQDCYGKLVEVEFVNKIRDEQKFASVEQLTQQISSDVAHAKSMVENIK